MSRAVMVRYQTTAEAAEANRELVEQVYAELHAGNPDGLRYVTIQLPDGVTFVHLAIVDAAENPLSQVTAFQNFQHGLAERLVEGPTVQEVRVVGLYGH
jgi:hypothetical protein